jgi:hypothetical protein
MRGNVDTKKVLEIFEPMLTDCLARLRSRNRKVDAKDVRVIFLPVLRSIARLVGGDKKNLVNNRLSDWEPADVNERSLQTFIGRIVEAATPSVAPAELAEMRRKVQQLNEELSRPVDVQRPPVEFTC